MLYRTAFGKRIGYQRRFEDGEHPQEDWNLWNKMLEQKATVASLKEGLLFYRRHRENHLKYQIGERPAQPHSLEQEDAALTA
jgi:hypothetical protein